MRSSCLLLCCIKTVHFSILVLPRGTDMCRLASVCHRLREALYNPAPSAATDLCHQDAMGCDNQGHIEDFMLAQFVSVSGLNCQTFPPAFGALPKLRRLDLSNNGLNTDIANVEAVLGTSSTLRWLLLWATGLTGTLSCNILSPSLTLLSLTRNDIEVGIVVAISGNFRGEVGTGQVPQGGIRQKHSFLSPQLLELETVVNEETPANMGSLIKCSRQGQAR